MQTQQPAPAPAQFGVISPTNAAQVQQQQQQQVHWAPGVVTECRTSDAFSAFAAGDTPSLSGTLSLAETSGRRDSIVTDSRRASLFTVVSPVSDSGRSADFGGAIDGANNVPTLAQIPGAARRPSVDGFGAGIDEVLALPSAMGTPGAFAPLSPGHQQAVSATPPGTVVLLSPPAAPGMVPPQAPLMVAMPPAPTPPVPQLGTAPAPQPPKTDVNPDNNRNLLVAGLSPGVNDAALRAMFEPFGALESALVMLDVASGRSRGFGFVMFEKHEDATTACHSLHLRRVGDSRLRVMPSLHRGQPAGKGGDTVFLRNLPTSMGEEAARTLFRTVGEPEEVCLMPDHTYRGGQGRGPQQQPQEAAGEGPTAFWLATVKYAAPDDARKLITRLHGKKGVLEWQGRADDASGEAQRFEVPLELPLLAKFAEPRDERRARQAGLAGAYAEQMRVRSHYERGKNGTRAAANGAAAPAQAMPPGVPVPMPMPVPQLQPPGMISPPFAGMASPPMMMPPAPHPGMVPMPAQLPPGFVGGAQVAMPPPAPMAGVPGMPIYPGMPGSMPRQMMPPPMFQHPLAPSAANPHQQQQALQQQAALVAALAQQQQQQKCGAAPQMPAGAFPPSPHNGGFGQQQHQQRH